jgi:hypothetical protein
LAPDVLIIEEVGSSDLICTITSPNVNVFQLTSFTSSGIVSNEVDLIVVAPDDFIVVFLIIFVVTPNVEGRSDCLVRSSGCDMVFSRSSS